MKTILISLLVFSSLLSCKAQEQATLKISNNQHYIVTQNNEPFFWLGGTAWEMLHRLNKEDTSLYLKDRASKGFTVIQTVILAESDGLTVPNANGDLPLINQDPTKINENYFKHIDYVLKQADSLGLYIGLLPTWGDKFNKKWGAGPEIFTPKNAEIFGEILAKRYKNQSNIIWVLGGDRIPEKDVHTQIIQAMAKGIRKIDGNHLITYHPSGNVNASDYFNENWLDIDMYQTGHSRDVKDYEYIEKSKKTAIRPIINGEPRYENIKDRFWEEGAHLWMDDTDVRTSAYWTMLSGAAGYTYGCNDIWQMYSIDKKPILEARTGWKQALHLQGSFDVMRMKKLISAFPWQEMKNDQSLILNKNQKDSTYIVSAIGNKKDFILAYTPMGKAINIDASKMTSEKINAFWYNPRSGESIKIGEYKTVETPEFKPWSTGRGSDFVLVILDSNSNYEIPE